MYFPDQRHVLQLATIVRERLLPEDAIGSVSAKEGDRVDMTNAVAHGTVPARYVIVEAAEFFKLRNPNDLDKLIMVEEGQAVEEEETLARQTGRRGKKLLSPVTGIVSHIEDGRIILQETPEIIDLQAGLNGTVVRRLSGRGVVIEAAAGIIQGVWGNGKTHTGVLRPEPDGGLESIYGDQLDLVYRGAIVVTQRTLKATGLLIMEDQGINGVIAPSMDVSLREEATHLRGAVLLTEGFGSMRMSNVIGQLLDAMQGRQATIDAVLPKRWDKRRPEVIINQPRRNTERPPRMTNAIALRTGMTVRLTRPPYEGQTGKVVDLPKSPVMLQNGLRVMCARVQLVSGQTVPVPLANIELFGR